ncbi:MAG: hypothetical protein J5494_05860 [Candidatus Methanomethylophilaceae archaeon]|nr:hypothetical protein [Candidatus Methanomethylophilaceae archaeon]
MWYWILAVVSAAVLLYKILHDVRGELSERAGLPAAAGVTAGIAVCVLASSFGSDSFSLSVFGMHISLLALGLTAAIASLLSGNIRNLLMLASGIVTAASIALTYAGYVGLYAGVLLLSGTSCLAAIASGTGSFADAGTLKTKRSILLMVSMAAMTFLLCAGTAGIVTECTDYLDVRNVAAAASFATAETAACILAFRSGGYRETAVAASVLTVVAASLFIFSSLFLRGMMY